MKIYIITFGCKVNQYESEAILELLLNSGFKNAENVNSADVVIFNSCTVTSESGKKLRKSINHIKNYNCNCIIILMGCLPQAFSNIKSEFKDVDIIIGNSNKNKLVYYISEFLAKKSQIIDIKPNSEILESLSIRRFSGHTRAFLKIEDGCNRFCSYCIIPYARGRVRSKTIADIKEEVHNLVNNGYQEVSLVGINLSSYGIDLGLDLYDAVSVVSDVYGIKRIRLGSLEPDLIDEKFLKKLSKIDKFCPQFHLSLQSGSNKILKSMRRLYTKEEYIDTVNKIRNIFANATITTDLIVGFPGENEDDFHDSLDIINKIGFLKVHIFPYSERPGTLAANMPEKISRTVKSSRMKIIREEFNKQVNSVFSRCVGQRFEVLYESLRKNGFYEGYTQNYILVKTKSNIDIRGKIVNTYITDYTDNGCMGIIV